MLTLWLLKADMIDPLCEIYVAGLQQMQTSVQYGRLNMKITYLEENYHSVY